MNRLEAVTGRAPSRAEFLMAALVALAITLWVFGGAVHYYFCQDDFEFLARAAGLAPRGFSPWRPIPNLGFFAAMRLFVGLDPRPYHAASLACHALAATLGYAYLRRFLSRGAAALGAGFYLCHPALFTALYWISAINVSMMAVWALVTLHLEQASGRVRFASLLGLALALLSRESALALPLVVMAVRAHQGTLRRRDPVLLAMWGMALGYFVWLTAVDPFGVRGGTGAAAYHVA